MCVCVCARTCMRACVCVCVYSVYSVSSTPSFLLSVQCKLIALFQDIVEVKYQPGIAARGQLQILSSIVDDPLIVRTSQLPQAMNMANIIEGYCQCITGDRRSRMRGFSVGECRGRGCGVVLVEEGSAPFSRMS